MRHEATLSGKVSGACTVLIVAVQGQEIFSLFFRFFFVGVCSTDVSAVVAVSFTRTWS